MDKGLRIPSWLCLRSSALQSTIRLSVPVTQGEEDSWEGLGTNVPVDTPGFSIPSRPLSVMATPFLALIFLYGVGPSFWSVVTPRRNATNVDVRLFADLRLKSRRRRREDATSTSMVT